MVAIAAVIAAVVFGRGLRRRGAFPSFLFFD
jgi:hypothetical protein